MKIADNVKGQIGLGVLVLLGVEVEDDQEDIKWLSKKIANLRIFSDTQGVMNKSLIDVGGDALIISQFTLLASTKKGNRPSYSKAAKPELAIPLYEKFIDQLSSDLGKPVETGEFGADMKVNLVNDGPVTIIIDTKDRK